VDQPLELVPAVTLCGGVALYLLGHVVFRLRNVGSLNHRRLIAALVSLAIIPVVIEVDALVAMGLVTAICCGLIVYELIRHGEARERVRAVAS